MVRHAIAAEEKQARRTAILEAARRLFAASNGELPSVAEIAVAAGLAKGTLYLYFRTKEEIFVALLLEGLLALFDKLEATIRGWKGRREQKVAALLDAYCSYAASHHELMRLDALCQSVLEKNLDQEKLREFKLTFAARLQVVGTQIEQALQLAPTRGSIILMRTFALTRGLWQPEQGMTAKATKQDPALSMLCPDFATELAEALAEYWRGALAG